MNERPLKLVTRPDETAQQISEKLAEITDLAKHEPFVGLAVVLLKSDGTSCVSTLGYGNRILLLGTLVDLVYTVARDGDKE